MWFKFSTETHAVDVDVVVVVVVVVDGDDTHTASPLLLGGFGWLPAHPGRDKKVRAEDKQVAPEVKLVRGWCRVIFCPAVNGYSKWWLEGWLGANWRTEQLLVQVWVGKSVLVSSEMRFLWRKQLKAYTG